MGRRQSSQTVSSTSRASEETEQPDGSTHHQSRERIHQEETNSSPPHLPPQNARQSSIISRKSGSRPETVVTAWVDSEQDRPYDLTPVATPLTKSRRKSSTPSYTIDPFEFSPTTTPVNERETK
jgi:hypothetical protein